MADTCVHSMAPPPTTCASIEVGDGLKLYCPEVEGDGLVHELTAHQLAVVVHIAALTWDGHALSTQYKQ